MDGTACGADQYGVTDLCLKRCLSGVCTGQVVTCTDPNLQDCDYPICNPQTGLCTLIGYQNITQVCSDGNLCTYSDHCDGQGNCQGTILVCPPSDSVCLQKVCDVTTGLCTDTPLGGTIYCNADNNSCTTPDICKQGVCKPGAVVVCPTPDICTEHFCNTTDGECYPDYTNSSCNDNNQCTDGDICHLGVCAGVSTETTRKLPACGFVQSPVQEANPTVPITVITVTVAAALIGAIIGAVFLIKKIRQSKLMDPDTWNPDVFSSVGANPLYKGSVHTVDNRLYEAQL